MMDQMTLFQDGIVAGKRIFKILDATQYEPKQNAQTGLTITKGKIEFKHVSFSYGGKNEILHDISFTVNPGETLGIVGHTGSGKSSIINVMMRFYEFHKGEILIDGVNIKKNIQKKELRKKSLVWFCKILLCFMVILVLIFVYIIEILRINKLKKLLKQFKQIVLLKRCPVSIMLK